MGNQTVLFIEPKDAFSNEAILVYLSRKSVVEARRIETTAGDFIDVYELDFQELKHIEASAKTVRLRFQIYRKRGNGRAERWDIYKKKKMSSEKKKVTDFINKGKRSNN